MFRLNYYNNYINIRNVSSKHYKDTIFMTCQPILNLNYQITLLLINPSKIVCVSSKVFYVFQFNTKLINCNQIS